jgi:hypothetical protein
MTDSRTFPRRLLVSSATEKQHAMAGISESAKTKDHPAGERNSGLGCLCCTWRGLQPTSFSNSEDASRLLAASPRRACGVPPCFWSFSLARAPGLDSGTDSCHIARLPMCVRCRYGSAGFSAFVWFDWLDDVVLVMASWTHPRGR